MRKYIFLFFAILLLGDELSYTQLKLAAAKSQFLYTVMKIDSTLYLGGDKLILKSTGTGINDWTGINSDIRDIQRFHKYKEKIMAVANSGIYEINNPQSNSPKINTGILTAACLLTLEDVWLAGITSDGVYRSIDQGKNWIYNPNYDNDSLADVSSLLEVGNKILAVTARGLQSSKDRGLSWQKIDTTITGVWYCGNTLINSGDTIYAGGEGGLLRSIDGAQTWKSLGLSNVRNVIIAANKIFVMTMSSIYFSRDKGETWLQISPVGYESGWSFQPSCLEVFGDNLFVATTRGLYYIPLIYLDSPRLQLTTEGEINFGNIAVTDVKDTAIAIANIGYKELVVTDIICNSSDIEITPRTFTLPPQGGMALSIKVQTRQTGSINEKMIIKSNSLEGTEEIPIMVNVLPIDYQLGQNYPNPFNPYTTIRYQISDIRHVVISIYNSLGEKVSTVLDEVIEPGKHEVVFDASKLSSGIYFYKITAGDFVETKKMLLVK